MSFPLVPSMKKMGCTGEFGCGCSPVRGEPRHGQRAMYQKGCKCSVCALANRNYQRGYNRANGVEKRMAPHGTMTRLNQGCKCEPCKNAKRAYDRDRHKRIKEGTWKA